MTLVLEPPDGGDHILELGPKRRVEQVKMRSRGTWSVRDVARKVLPDLVKAADLTRPTEYRFVTDSGITADHKLKSLVAAAQQQDQSEPWLALPDGRRRSALRRKRTKTAAVGRAQALSERQIFDEIVRHSTSRQEKKSDIDANALRRKVWHVLANFEIEAGVDFDECAGRVNAWLNHFVEMSQDVSSKRNELIVDLLRHATTGNHSIRPEEFFRRHRLGGLTLRDWDAHAHRARFIAVDSVKQLGYGSTIDIRPDFASTIASEWTTHRKSLVLTGESGQGKTWLAASIALQLASRGEIVLMVDATGNASADLQQAASVWWNRILGQEMSLNLEGIRNRLRNVDSTFYNRPVFLVVDGLQSPDEARELARAPLDAWAIRLAITGPAAIERQFVDVLGEERCQIVEVPNFTIKELQDYLSKRLGDEWANTPSYLLSTLETPLLARYYADLAVGRPWRPTHEYELYEGRWRQLVRSSQGDHPMDPVLLAKRASSLVERPRYPWTVERLCGDWPNDSFIPRLVKKGWLTSTDGVNYTVPQERLLNWAVAEGLVARVRDGELTGAQLVDSLQSLLQGHPHATRLRYVKADVLWLLTEPEGALPTVAAEVLAATEND